MKKEIASINLSLKRKLCQRNFSYEKWAQLVSVGLLIVVGNAIAGVGAFAKTVHEEERGNRKFFYEEKIKSRW